jgi:isoquinoline 1-oxidoreductase
VELNAARALPGVKKVEVVKEDVAAIGERYTDVVKALNAVEAKWSTPTRPKEFNFEEEIRANAKFIELKEEQGNVDSGLAASYLTVSETYITHFTTQAPIETDTALVRLENGGNKATVWVSSQHPHKAREIIARSLRFPESDVRVIGMPAGGGFGGKTSNPVTGEAARLARLAGAPVKLLYSRKNQFQWRSRYKMACVIDLTTGISSGGRMLARKIDTYQDVGDGTVYTYDIPNVLTRNFQAKLPFKRAISRGTSYVQNCFATESHIDMVAAAIGIDPFEFRRNNVWLPAFINVIDACAEMIDYYNYQPEADEGIGLAITHHGDSQLGAIAAEVAVNRETGQVKVKRICGAFDIGTVINHNTTTVGIRGAINWGIGYILSEEIKLDGHRAETAYLSDYRIPRFSDIPPIEIVYLDNHSPGSPRGCGELPVIPTIGAIANAVYNAVGIRFYSTPLTPSRVLKALEKA